MTSAADWNDGVAQPLGAFPYPAGLMLLPDDHDPQVEVVREGLLCGRLPDHWPPALEAHRLAHAGEITAAAEAIADGDAYARYNRWVLGATEIDAGQMVAELPVHCGALIDVVTYMNGEAEQPPALDAKADAVIAALVLAAQASSALTHGHVADAVTLLDRAAERVERVSPAFAAILRGNAGTVIHEHGGDSGSALRRLVAAAEQLDGTDLPVNAAEIHYQIGTIEHELAAAQGAALQPAMHHYYTCLQLITREDSPYLWASAQMNLSAAYLAGAMVQASDQLRMGIAVQSLRAALEVFTRERYPQQWATATLNLANALVYTPSNRQGDNLVEAVELYEQVLDGRDRGSDPLGRARVLANQGNALAHLGIFSEAKAKLYEARYLFEEALDHDSVLTVRSVLDEIVKASMRVEV